MIESYAQDWPSPSHPKPIVIIGAGGIVRSFNPQIDIYQIPQSGFAVQANWGGTVFSVDRDLQ